MCYPHCYYTWSLTPLNKVNGSGGHVAQQPALILSEHAQVPMHQTEKAVAATVARWQKVSLATIHCRLAVQCPYQFSQEFQTRNGPARASTSPVASTSRRPGDHDPSRPRWRPGRYPADSDPR